MRKNLLIKPKLQFFHLLWIIFVVIITSFCGYVLFESILSQSLATSQAAVILPSLVEKMRWGFVLIVLILVGGIGIENYFYFHRIVGPLYALEKGLKRLSKGHFTDPVKIRESDELFDLVMAFEDLKKELKTRMEINEKVARDLAKELDYVLSKTTPENIESLQERLKRIREQVVNKAA